MNKSVSLPCYDIWKYFHHHGIDLSILITFFVLTAILVVTANGCLLIKLLQKKDRVRVDKLFAIRVFFRHWNRCIRNTIAISVIVFS